MRPQLAAYRVLKEQVPGRHNDWDLESYKLVNYMRTTPPPIQVPPWRKFSTDLLDITPQIDTTCGLGGQGRSRAGQTSHFLNLSSRQE